MIGTHNSCTGYEPVHKIFNIIKLLWKCQEKTLDQQLHDGVEYFDIRVRYINNRWQCCHGIVDVKKYYLQLEEILLWGYINNVKIRLILERGNSEIFKNMVNTLSKKYDCLVFAAIKNNWQIILNRDLPITECYWTPFLRGISILDNIKRLFKIGIRNIKEYAIIHNPRLEIIKDSDQVVLMDYYNLNKYEQN